MITEIHVAGFKRLSDATIKIPRISVLMGPNGTGKSSILQSLLLLKQSLNNDQLKVNGSYVNLGTLEDLVARGGPQQYFDLSFRGIGEYQEPEGFPKKETFRYQWSGTFSRAGMMSSGYWVSSKREQIAAQQKRGVTQSSQTLSFEGFTVTVSGLPFIARTMGFSSSTGSQVDRDLQQRVMQRLSAISNFASSDLQSMRYVPASRGFTDASYDLLDSGIKDIPSSGLAEAQRHLASTMAYDEAMTSKVGEWLNTILGRGARARLAQEKKVVIESKRGDANINFVNEGYGTNQLVFLLGQLALAPEGALLAIEEPEIHIHPRAQAKLAEVLVGVAGEERKQILLTTHSEHLVYGLLALVRKGHLSPNEIALYHFPAEGELISPSELKVDDQGLLDGKLPDFFETDVSELGELLESLGAKRK